MSFTHRLFWVLLVALPVFAPNARAESRSHATQEQCIAYCTKADAECSAAARKAQAQCSRKAATNGLDPITLRGQNAALFCGYFNENHCDYARNRGHCQDRFRLRHGLCMDAYQKNTTQRYLACNESERDAVAMCRQELGDCKEACQ